MQISSLKIVTKYCGSEYFIIGIVIVILWAIFDDVASYTQEPSFTWKTIAQIKN